MLGWFLKTDVGKQLQLDSPVIEQSTATSLAYGKLPVEPSKEAVPEEKK